MDIPFDDINLNKLEKVFEGMLKSANLSCVFTPGPEFIVRAWKELLFRMILRSADLSLCDGFGTKIFGKIKNRITGHDALSILFKIADRSNKEIAIVGGDITILKTAEKKIKHTYPNLSILTIQAPQYVEHNDMISMQTPNWHEHQDLLRKINDFAPDILILGLGMPKQEKWIYANTSALNSVKIAIAVGGAIDVIGGKFSRAHRVFRLFGIEWLWRLMLQPSRIMRIFNAVILFSVFLIFFQLHRLKPKRKTVLAVIRNEKNEFLLINNRGIKKMTEEDHWQFVQGGIENNEEVQNALEREIFEETGISKLNSIRLSNIEYGFIRPFNSSFFISEYKIYYVYCKDANELRETEEASDFQWVRPENLIEALHPIRRELGKKILDDLNF